MSVIYHNIRDKAGRFSKDGATKRKSGKKKKVPAKINSIFNVFLLDDTGSMQDKVEATVEGFNQVLADGKLASKKANVLNFEAFSKFGRRGKQSWNVGNVLPLTSTWPNAAVWPSPTGDNTYNPHEPETALWEAVVKTIQRAEIELGQYPHGTKVIFTIFTDGENNCAYEYEILANQAIERKKKDGWVINFMGAGDQKTMERISGSVGIFAGNTLGYENTSKGTRSAMNKMSASRVTYTSSVGAGQTVSNDGFFSQD